jgi:hypothetical protein
MNDRPDSPDARAPGSSPRRLFLHEPGWRIGHKLGSEREFCYTIAPGQDYYHRLYDGELFLTHGDQRVCLACAERRGLLSYEPRGLREPPTVLDLDAPEPGALDFFPESNGDQLDLSY